MSPTFYHVVHVFSLLVLTAYTFYAFAGPAQESRKLLLSITGIASLLMLISGVGLMHKMGYVWSQSGWAVVKVVCWLGLSALGGLAYRRREKAGLLSVIALVLLLVAVYMVYKKPF